MQAEETRPSVPGSGLCSGYTMSRSILADAVALIRGDRFLTIEYTRKYAFTYQIDSNSTSLSSKPNCVGIPGCAIKS